MMVMVMVKTNHLEHKQIIVDPVHPTGLLPLFFWKEAMNNKFPQQTSHSKIPGGNLGCRVTNMLAE